MGRCLDELPDGTRISLGQGRLFRDARCGTNTWLACRRPYRWKGYREVSPLTSGAWSGRSLTNNIPLLKVPCDLLAGYVDGRWFIATQASGCPRPLDNEQVENVKIQG